MSLSIGGASTDLDDMEFPGVEHDSITIGVELELAIFNLNEDNLYNFLWFPLIKGGLKELEINLSKAGNAAAFAVKDDVSINTRWKGGLNPGVSIEIATPILLGDQFEWVVPEMCAAINKVVDEQDARIDLAPESECGLHVHIGVEGRHYTFAELKRIAKAIIIFEDVMDLHHAEHRRNYTGARDFIKSNRTSEHLKGLSIPQMVEKLDATTNCTELMLLTNSDPNQPGKYFKYNLTAARRFGTVEFRQAEGTIDEAAILKWIRNVITFVISAIRTDDDQFPILAYMAEEDCAWSEVISAYYGLPSPDCQNKPLVPRRDDNSDEESEDDLANMANLNLNSSPKGARAEEPSTRTDAPLRKRDTLRRLSERVSTKLHSYHIRERLSNRIKRSLAKIAKRMASPPA